MGMQSGLDEMDKDAMKAAGYDNPVDWMLSGQTKKLKKKKSMKHLDVIRTCPYTGKHVMCPELNDYVKYVDAYNFLINYWEAFTFEQRTDMRQRLNHIFGEGHSEYIGASTPLDRAKTDSDSGLDIIRRGKVKKWAVGEISLKSKKYSKV